MMKISIKKEEAIFESLVQSARSNRLLLFVGSGMSTCYDLPGWRQLTELLKNDNPDYTDLPKEFSKFEAQNGKLELHEFLERRLGRRPAEIKIQTHLLLEIQSLAIVTTNCDRVIETAARDLGAPLRVFITDNDLEDFESTPWLKLIKLHGCLDKKDTLVFTKEEYEKYPDRIQRLRGKVADLMGYCNVLFLGYSMADPDFFDLMALVSQGKQHPLRQMFGLFSSNEINGNWRKLHIDNKIRQHRALIEISFDNFGNTPDEAVVGFLKKLKNMISPENLPALQRQCVIMTNGYTATLKTELTRYLSDCLGIPLFATHRYGRCTNNGILDRKMRHIRYKQMLLDAERAAKRGQSIVLDGTFADPQWRKAVYKFVNETNSHLIIIETRCDDDSYIRIRLWRRRIDHSRSEHEVTHISNYYATRKAVQQHPIEKDVELKQISKNIILFNNNGIRHVKTMGEVTLECEIIADLIKKSHLMNYEI